MRRLSIFIGAGLLVVLTAGASYAQRPRPIDDSSQPTGVSAPKPPPAPQTFKAKYEGGIFAYTKKQDGTLSFDDANSRLVFRNKEQKEVLSMPYAAVSGAFADTQSRRPTAGKVIGSLPLPYGANIPAWFIKKKYRYLTLQFNDADTNVSGVTSFKLENKEILNSVLYTLAQKAGLDARGEGYVRRKEPKEPTP